MSSFTVIKGLAYGSYGMVYHVKMQDGAEVAMKCVSLEPVDKDQKEDVKAVQWHHAVAAEITAQKHCQSPLLGISALLGAQCKPAFLYYNGTLSRYVFFLGQLLPAKQKIRQFNFTIAINLQRINENQNSHESPSKALI